MMKIQGKMSVFGGMYDKGMKDDSGLALYEAWEADLRPDLFFLASYTGQPTWQRLKPMACYCAFRYDHSIDRKILQTTPYKITSVATGRWVVAWLVDWGPNESTGRVVDLSPYLSSSLHLLTDDEVILEPLIDNEQS